MSRPARRRGRRRASAGAAPAIRQISKRDLRNRLVPVEPLDAEQLEFIHDVSLDILETDGIEVLGDQALDMLRNAGADVSDEGLVRMERAMVLENIAKAPSEFSVTPRNPEHAIRIGGDAINFGLVSGPPNVHDNVDGRRAGNLDDYRKLISFGQYFNVLTFFGNQAIPPTDLPPNSRHLDTTYVNLTLADKAFFAIGIGAGRSASGDDSLAATRHHPQHRRDELVKREDRGGGEARQNGQRRFADRRQAERKKERGTNTNSAVAKLLRMPPQ